VWVGRMDSRVKVRGRRVELGEIENTLLQESKGRVEVAVAALQQGVLVAYVKAAVRHAVG
jgi:acyl-coenzyme A synthetase/AMP-(fatty) acid ligase